MGARNTIILIICFLAGLVLGQFVSKDLVAQPNLAARERASQAAADAFYRAANRYLETGDSDELTGILAANFVDHSAVGGSPDAAGLLRYLTALRKSYPDVRFSVASIAQDGALVVVALSTTASATALDAGFLADRPPSAPHNEALRITDGKVAERWAASTAGPQIELAATLDLPVISGWYVGSELEWLTLEPGASETVYGATHSLLLTGAGSLTLEIEPKDADLSPQLLSRSAATPMLLDRGEEIALDGEQVVQLPKGEVVQVSNLSDAPTSFIVLKLQYRSPAVVSIGGSTVRIDPTVEDIKLEPMALLPMKVVESRTYRFELFRVASAPAELLQPHRVDGLEQLFVAEGAVAVEAHVGVVHIFDGNGRKVAPLGEPLEVLPGRGISIVDNALLTYQVSGESPAVFWLVTLTPVTDA